jgi:hypothetical protein
MLTILFNLGYSLFYFGVQDLSWAAQDKSWTPKYLATKQLFLESKASGHFF